ncbi:XAC0095 family protein [Dyella nitratireducens]|uniref:XAC0095-like domain-containing protein n=1 Tax=Dyella nitratireducens TaxID=1849580 RepID=A0ABQ1G9F8_9GAMM|nr:hypothetical protein [Dyella nitratireducens]GGA39307.1 hypothetical protein GCM10010981_30700 [Dyella nitratireducens]GLQ40427.1 hypothetical protein GCM10007902_02760 [Dyella nitratireducens]
MADMQGEPRGPQLYLLSQDGYEILKHLQDMLTLMAHISYNEDNAENGDTTITIGRAELYFIFEAINMKLDEVLEPLGDENWLGAQNQAWQ